MLNDLTVRDQKAMDLAPIMFGMITMLFYQPVKLFLIGISFNSAQDKNNSFYEGFL